MNAVDTKSFPFNKLPEPIIENEDLKTLYWKTWEFAYSHIRTPQEGSGFPSKYIDVCFNNNLFQWDFCFIVHFAKYGYKVFPVPDMLSNMYAKQRPDGFIYRELKPDGTPLPTQDMLNPPLYSWKEYDCYKITGNKDRLKEVYPILVKFHNWINRNRKGKKGLYYFEHPIGSGMDDQPRSGDAWIDLSAQYCLDAYYLAKIASVLGMKKDERKFINEHKKVAKKINTLLWDNKQKFYVDGNNKPTQMKSIASFWTLISRVASKERARHLVKHLTNVSEFWRPVPVPAMSKDSKDYNFPDGHYWKGSVWAPTNIMVIKGLKNYGYHGLAKTIALQYLRSMANVLKEDGTIYEFYSSEYDKGQGCRNMVGWSGAGPVASLIEDILGFEECAATAEENKICWRPMLLQKHGIKNLSFGSNVVSIIAEERKTFYEPLKVKISAEKPFTLHVFLPFGAEGCAVYGKNKIAIKAKKDNVKINVQEGEHEFLIKPNYKKDKSVPAAPILIKRIYKEGKIFLKWLGNIEEDIAGYNVYKIIGNKREKINSSLLLFGEFIYKAEDMSCDYVVTAVDVFGNESKDSIYTPTEIEKLE